MKERVLEFLTKHHPKSMTSQQIGLALGAQSTEDAISSVRTPLTALIDEKKITFDFFKKEGDQRKDVHYSLKTK